jgi:hypothetical protein
MRARARLLGLALGGALACGALPTAAQPAPGPGPARPPQSQTGPARSGPPGHASAPARAAPSSTDLPGPRVALSYRAYSLRDDLGGRRVHTGGFAGFLPTRFIRAGAGAEAGIRTHELDGRQGLVSGNLFVGYQHLRGLGQVVPYACALGELGIVLQKRFHTPLSEGYRGAGLELGADIKVVRSLYMGLGISFMLYTMDGLAYDTFGLRLSIGL